MSNKKSNERLVKALIGAGTATLVTLAIKEQLNLPEEQRTWQGKVLGVPYNFRIPSKENIRSAYWNTETSQIIVPRPFGMGWTVNFYPLVHPKTLQ